MSYLNGSIKMRGAGYDQVAQDLVRALQHDNFNELCDVSLVGADGIAVPANRFILAARCKVLRRMLYGTFLEANASTIRLLAFDSIILRAIVEFCHSNRVEHFLSSVKSDEISIRRLIQLDQAADYLQLEEVQTLAQSYVLDIMAKHPPLACIVCEEAVSDTRLSEAAWHMIECRPYITLDICKEHCGGGVQCLGGKHIIELVRNPFVDAGELFLFRMLLKWYKAAVLSDESLARRVAKQCASLIRFENIEPRELLSPDIQESPLISKEYLFMAVATQALRASHSGLWSLRCRGRDSHLQRILVEGAGAVEANGIYFHMARLKSGDLYTKREVSCGQKCVFTLSCSQKENNNDIECRIFASPVLTHGAIPFMCLNPRARIQPVLQVTSIHSISPDTLSTTCPKALLSDGDFSVSAEFSQSLFQQMSRDGMIRQNSIIQVLECSLVNDGTGDKSLRVHRIGVVLEASEYQFGKPVDVNSLSNDDLQSCYSPSRRNELHGLLNLYSCSLPTRHHPNRIHGTQWKVEEHGDCPSPTCLWIHPVAREACNPCDNSAPWQQQKELSLSASS